MATERQYELADAKRAGKTLLLIDSKTRQRYKAGDVLHSFRGETYTLSSFDPRRVYVRRAGMEFNESFFPSVFGCEVVIEGEGVS
jgi:hypothetical protein